MRVADGAGWCQTLQKIGPPKNDNRSISYYEHLWTDVVHFGGTSSLTWINVLVFVLKVFFQGCRLSPLAQYPLKSSRSVSARSPMDRWPKCMKPLVFPRCSIGQLQKCKQWRYIYGDMRYCISLIMTMGYPGYCESTKEWTLVSRRSWLSYGRMHSLSVLSDWWFVMHIN